MARELTREEKKSIRALVTKWCANYDRDYGCLPLESDCYMLMKCWTGPMCRYFREAVLPIDPALAVQLAQEGAGGGAAYLPPVRQGLSPQAAAALLLPGGARRRPTAARAGSGCAADAGKRGTGVTIKGKIGNTRSSVRGPLWRGPDDFTSGPPFSRINQTSCARRPLGHFVPGGAARGRRLHGQKIKGYSILRAAMLENGRGFALGEHPTAPSRYVTWACYDDEHGQRQYEWGPLRERSERDGAGLQAPADGISAAL